MRTIKKRPDYKRIYTDILLMKYPEKTEICQRLLKKDQLSVTDVININSLIFGNANGKESTNQKLKSYDRSTIFAILDYQKKNQCNNMQLARHFKLSRNTVAKWKKIFFGNY